MTDDDYKALVARLRAMADHPWNEHGPSETLRSATDAIEALMAERDDLHDSLTIAYLKGAAEGKARAKRAEAALRPFAAIADQFPDESDHEGICGVQLGDLRRARAVLAQIGMADD